MATVIINLSNFNADDQRAAKFVIYEENQRRVQENLRITATNAIRAAMDPPLAALPLLGLLPTANVGQIKASYEPLLAAMAFQQHVNLITVSTEKALAGNTTDIAKIKGLSADATPEKRAAALAAYEAAIA